METTQALALSPALTAYALETGTDITTDTTAGVWGYFITFNPWHDKDENRTTGPYTGVEAINEIAFRTVNCDKNIAIVARFPAGTGYAYTL